jgi:hypothetical protein
MMNVTLINVRTFSDTVNILISFFPKSEIFLQWTFPTFWTFRIFRVFRTYKELFRTFQDFSGLFRTFQDFSGLLKDTVYIVI